MLDTLFGKLKKKYIYKFVMFTMFLNANVVLPPAKIMIMYLILPSPTLLYVFTSRSA